MKRKVEELGLETALVSLQQLMVIGSVTLSQTFPMYLAAAFGAKTIPGERQL